MNDKLDTRRLVIYLLLAFGLAWTCGLVVYLTGGLADSRVLIPGTSITLALVLFAVGYMWAPGFANILTRLITKEGWKNTYLRTNFRKGWPYWVAAWLLPAFLTVLGAALYFALFPEHYDPSLQAISDQLDRTTGGAVDFSPWIIVIINTTTAIFIAPLVNGFFTFGEEFGWRAYLQPRLMPFGGRIAILLMGVIWGVWHWPAIAMGHNYGLNYPGYPLSGMLAMVWFTLVTGTFLGWLVIKSGSVWPAVIGHGAINGIAAIGILFVQGQPNPLLGPVPTGLIASIPWALFALLIFLLPNALNTPEPRQGIVKDVREDVSTAQ